MTAWRNDGVVSKHTRPVNDTDPADDQEQTPALFERFWLDQMTGKCHGFLSKLWQVWLVAIEAAVIPGRAVRSRTARTHVLAEVFRLISDCLYLSAWICLRCLGRSALQTLTLSLLLTIESNHALLTRPREGRPDPSRPTKGVTRVRGASKRMLLIPFFSEDGHKWSSDASSSSSHIKIMGCI